MGRWQVTFLLQRDMTVYRHGPLDLATLERCLLEIIRRHDIWRTTFEVIRANPSKLFTQLLA